MVAVGAGRNASSEGAERLLQRSLALSAGDGNARLHHAMGGQRDKAWVAEVGEEGQRETGRCVLVAAHLLGVGKRGFVPVVAVGDQNRQVFEGGVGVGVVGGGGEHARQVAS